MNGLAALSLHGNVSGPELRAAHVALWRASDALEAEATSFRLARRPLCSADRVTLGLHAPPGRRPSPRYPRQLEIPAVALRIA
jgi:hypothetical protein